MVVAVARIVIWHTDELVVNSYSLIVGVGLGCALD